MKKHFIKLFFLLSFLLLNVSTFAQFEVEFNEIKNSLTMKDKYKPGFGRYDGYEIPLYSGEAVNFVVYAEKFSPRLLFVDSKGSIYKQSIPSKNNVASIITKVPSNGEWILYVVSDSASVGDYTFQYALAAANSLELSKDADFCTSLSFVIAHSKAYFLLFDNPVDSKHPFTKLSGSIDSFLDEEFGAYNSKMYEGNNLSEAEKKFKELSEQVSKCFDKSWNQTTGNWQAKEDFKEKSIVFDEQVKDKPREIKITLRDVKSSKQKFTGDYVINITVLRKN